MTTENVTVIGGGAAGVLLVAHLARLATKPVRVAVVDTGEGRIGSGTAYRTADPDHLLNVCADGLSAWVDQPKHFLCWLAGRGTPARPGEFVARGTYGAYLAAVAYDAWSGRFAHVRHVRGRAVDIRWARPFWEVQLADGTTLTSEHVVLATGVQAPAPLAAAGHHPRYVADPWRPGALGHVGETEPVLLIGAGLTAVDVATTLGRNGNRRIAAVSRHGLLPAAHVANARAPMPVRPEMIGENLTGLRRHMRDRIAVSLAATGDWRPAVDGVRPYAQQLWRHLDERDKREFVRRDRRHWEVARHRMAPRVAAIIAGMLASGQLTIAAVGADTAIWSADPRTWIINTTGPAADLRRCPAPLWSALFDIGAARPGPLGIGVATAPTGQLIDPVGNAVPGLWTLGCTRRGELWESTAIPEIRAQAQLLAERIDVAVRAAVPRELVMEG